MAQRKKENWQYTAKLTFLWYHNFGKKKGLCIGKAGLPFQKFNKFNKMLDKKLKFLPVTLSKDMS